MFKVGDRVEALHCVTSMERWVPATVVDAGDPYTMVQFDEGYVEQTIWGNYQWWCDRTEIRVPVMTTPFEQAVHDYCRRELCSL